MKAARVVVLGGSGTGKTTLARALAARLVVPFFDSDAYYHLPTDPPFQAQRTPEERCRLLEGDLAGQASWAIAGNVGTWDPAPRLDTTLHVFLTLPRELRLARLLARERATYGERILPGGDMATTHAEFMAWTAGYEDGTASGTSTLPGHEAWLARAGGLVLRLPGPLDIDAAVARVVDATR